MLPGKTITNHLQLPVKVNLTHLSLLCRMLTYLNRIVLTMYSKSIQTNRLKYIKTHHSLIPTIYVSSGKGIHIPHMQPLGRRVRKHHQVIKRLFCLFNIHLIQTRLTPFLTPSCLNLFWVIDLFSPHAQIVPLHSSVTPITYLYTMLNIPSTILLSLRQPI